MMACWRPIDARRPLLAVAAALTMLLGTAGPGVAGDDEPHEPQAPPRLMGWINLFGAQHALGPDAGVVNGVRGEWRGEEAVAWLIDELERFREAGVHTVMLNRPMGDAGPGDVSAAAWETIPPYKRAQLRDQLGPHLQEHEQMRVYVFIGTSWTELDSLRTAVNDPSQLKGFDPEIPQELEAWRAVRDPWQEIGIHGVVLDASSPDDKRPWVRRLIEYERGRGERAMDIWWEAIPSGDGAQADRELAPSVALMQFIQHQPRGWHDYEPGEGEHLIAWLTHNRDPEQVDPIDWAVQRLELGWHVMARPQQIEQIRQAMPEEDR